jgi:CheY-like chemotaxis protein
MSRNIVAPPKRLDILLVEDNPDDIFFAQMVLEESNFKNQLYTVTNGEEALQFLHQQPPYAHFPRPDIVLLDLNLPKINGLQVLRQVKENLHLRSIPIIVLTTSEDKAEITQVYQAHANAYIVKPIDLNDFQKVLENIQLFWQTIVKLPPT